MLAETPAPGRVRPATLAVACAAPLLALVNYTVPMVTLPETARALDAGPTGPVWMLNSVTLGLAVSLLLAGGFADDHGRRRVYALGMASLAVSSAIVALSDGVPVFVFGRFAQGVASAAVLAASLGIVGHAYPAGPERLRATGRYGAMLGLGIAVGPLVSGGLAALSSWRSVYWVMGGAAAALAVLAVRTLPESRAAKRRRLDVPGTVTLTLGLAALVTGVTEGRLGWTRPVVLAAFAAAALLLIAFALVETRRREPLIDMDLFRHPPFVAATGGALVTGVAIIGLMSYLPSVLQLSLGMTPVGTAALLAVWSGASFVSALLTPRVRLATRARLALGLLLAAAGSLPLLGTVAHWSAAPVIAGLLVAGIGSGLINASLTHLAIESVPSHWVSMGSGANNTARYVGSSVGAALMAAVVGGHGLAAGTDITIIGYAVVAALAAALIRFAPS
ncbi:MFS transporter [Microtetraspora sp. AC03309]|uniref:MFS transporter n=1 Tax=Microtetraspora sp. AC03309 TaxID=2779376 RepID=UPI001E2CCCDE|nr:MFS transporter [Microtetraspora sp. AC03309]MCC5577964.1 MFS transporter [Microtetraspora sp. AC03309]